MDSYTITIMGVEKSMIAILPRPSFLIPTCGVPGNLNTPDLTTGTRTHKRGLLMKERSQPFPYSSYELSKT